MTKDTRRFRGLFRDRPEEAAWTPLLRVGRKNAFAQLILDIQARGRKRRERSRPERNGEAADE